MIKNNKGDKFSVRPKVMSNFSQNCWYRLQFCHAVFCEASLSHHTLYGKFGPRVYNVSCISLLAKKKKLKKWDYQKKKKKKKKASPHQFWSWSNWILFLPNVINIKIMNVNFCTMEQVQYKLDNYYYFSVQNGTCITHNSFKMANYEPE